MKMNEDGLLGCQAKSRVPLPSMMYRAQLGDVSEVVSKSNEGSHHKVESHSD